MTEFEKPIGLLDGVIFPTRRRTVGQAGTSVAQLCTAIIKLEGSGVDTNSQDKLKKRPSVRASRLPTLSIIWNNPKMPIRDILQEKPQRLRTG